MALPGILDMVSRVEGGPYFTISQMATMLGKDADTIRRWAKNNESLKPTHKMDLGDGSKGSFVWLYTEEDVQRYREHAKTVKVGRPRKED